MYAITVKAADLTATTDGSGCVAEISDLPTDGYPDRIYVVEPGMTFPRIFNLAFRVGSPDDGLVYVTYLAGSRVLRVYND